MMNEEKQKKNKVLNNKLFKLKKSIKNILFNRKMKYDGLILIFVIIFVSIIILFNIVISKLVDRFDVKIDLSSNSLYKVSRQTKEFLQDYDRDVKLILLNSEENYKNGDIYVSHIYNIAKNVASCSPHISLEYINLYEQPNFFSKYAGYNLQQNGILVDGGDNRVKFLSISDMFQKQYQDSPGVSDVEIVSSVEKNLAQTLENLTGERKINLYALKGHDEINLQENNNIFSSNGYNILNLDVKNEEIPEEAEVIVIVSPNADYEKEEILKLEKFVNKGKKLIYFASASQPVLPKLEEFLNKNFGIKYKEGVVVETDATRMAPSYPNEIFLYADMENRYVKNYYNKKLPIRLSDCKPVELKNSSKDLEIINICQTSKTSAAFINKEEFDINSAEKKPFVLAAAANKKVSNNRVATAILFSSSYMLGYVDDPQFGNGDLVLSVLDETVGWNRKIKILPKIISTPSLAINKTTANVLAIIFIFIVPFSVAVFAVVVYYKRKRR